MSLRMGRTRGPDHYEIAVHGSTDVWPGDARWRGEEAKRVEQDIRRIGFYNGCRIRAIQKHDIVRTVVGAVVALWLWGILSGSLCGQEASSLAGMTAELESSLARCPPQLERAVRDLAQLPLRDVAAPVLRPRL